jgi:hypothetical protein
MIAETNACLMCCCLCDVCAFRKDFVFLFFFSLINYTKLEHMVPKCPAYGEKSSFMGKKVEFFNRIILYMRTFLLLRLQFVLISTCMDSFNQIYVISYTKFDYFGPKCPVYGGKTRFLSKIIEVFNRIVLYMRKYILPRLQFTLNNTYRIYSTVYM